MAIRIPSFFGLNVLGEVDPPENGFPKHLKGILTKTLIREPRRISEINVLGGPPPRNSGPMEEWVSSSFVC